jgi:hypothetical protein
MKLGLLLLGAAALPACMVIPPPIPPDAPTNEEIHAGAAADLDAARAAASHTWVMADCAPDWHGRCGLWTDRLASNQVIDHATLGIEQASGEAAPRVDLAHSKLAEVVQRLCAQPIDQPTTSECKRRFGQVFVDAMKARYTMVFDERLLGWCPAHPNDCDPAAPARLRALELDFLLAHDRGVSAEWDRQQARIARGENEAMMDAAEQRQAIARAEEERREAYEAAMAAEVSDLRLEVQMKR